jgi:hypothetical protein
MPKALPGFIIFCPLALLIHASAEAQTQKRNFNLNCGLIGSFAQYPQHSQLCKWEILCSDARTCVRKLVAPEKLEVDPKTGNLVSETAGEAANQNGSLGASVSAQGNVSAGGLSGSARAGASAGVNADGGGRAAAGGSLGLDGP